VSGQGRGGGGIAKYGAPASSQVSQAENSSGGGAASFFSEEAEGKRRVSSAQWWRKRRDGRRPGAGRRRPGSVRVVGNERVGGGTSDIGRRALNVEMKRRRCGDVTELLHGGWFGEVKECEHRTLKWGCARGIGGAGALFSCVRSSKRVEPPRKRCFRGSETRRRGGRGGFSRRKGRAGPPWPAHLSPPAWEENGTADAKSAMGRGVSGEAKRGGDVGEVPSEQWKRERCGAERRGFRVSRRWRQVGGPGPVAPYRDASHPAEEVESSMLDATKTGLKLTFTDRPE
jgi:hypothetical protein